MSKIISDSSIIEKVSENGVYLSNRVPVKLLITPVEAGKGGGKVELDIN